MLSEPRLRVEFPMWAGASDDQWSDWKWQFRNRISTSAQLNAGFALTRGEQDAAERSKEFFRLGVTPHYATLIDPDDPFCPIRLQAVPQIEELIRLDHEMADPLNEDADSPAPGLTHRYPDRVLLLVTHECALYCRYCTRRRIVGDRAGSHRERIDAAIDYIRATSSIRDVLISGGEPLGLSDDRLEDILAKLRRIDHVEIIRIGTRMPVVMPQRITPALVAMLRRHHPLWLNTHFNHPFELMPRVTREAMERLVDAGIPTGNQTALPPLLFIQLRFGGRAWTFSHAGRHRTGHYGIAVGTYVRLGHPHLHRRCPRRRRENPSSARLQSVARQRQRRAEKLSGQTIHLFRGRGGRTRDRWRLPDMRNGPFQHQDRAGRAALEFAAGSAFL
jgi:KamA family protein